MKTLNLEIQDDYFEKVFNFLKILPENIVKINDNSINNDFDEKELLSRVDDIQNNKVKPLTRDELFNDL
jgi:hypothetical protein